MGSSFPGTENGIILSGGWTSAKYGFQLAIDDDPNYFIALRQRGNGTWSTWKRIPMGDGTGASGTWGINITGNADTLDGYHYNQLPYIQRLNWWNDSDSHNANDLLSGTTFAYSTHSNCPTTGTIVAFNCINSTGYPLQLQGKYYGEELWFRNRNGDNGTWQTWRYVIHNGNIGSQSVNYANSAGQLSTTRYIYGNAFNGTQNVTGNLTLSTGDQINFQDPNNDGVAFNYNNNKSSPSSIRIYNGRMSEIARFTTSGNFGIGTASPSYKLHVNGNIYSSGQIIREGHGAMWIYGRDAALLRETSAPGYHTLWSLKTTNGSWDFGEYNTSGWYNVPVLSYITDSNYNSGNNVTTYQIKFPLASGTVALTSYGGDNSHPIFLGYLNLEHGNDGTVSSSFYCLGYSVPFTYTRGGNYCRIYIPDTLYQTFYIRAAIASVNYSGGGMDTWVGDHRGDGAWWLHCYASGLNEVRVKGFC